VEGIERYDRGDLKWLVAALERAVAGRRTVDREPLRAATEPYSMEAWCAGHAEAFAQYLGVADARAQARGRKGVNAPPVELPPLTVKKAKPGKRGIYCVAFGEPARACALRLMESAKKHMPDVPIALCAAKKIGPEDVLITQPDSDVGGRRAKLRAYELAPGEWGAVLYLDADTEVVAPIYRFFEWIEAGWEFVITKDPHLMDTMHAFERRNNKRELLETEQAVRTLHTLQWNGGVWAFGRNARVKGFFDRWLREWEVHAQRDQGALVRAMYEAPLRILTLGNEWNTFLKYSKGVTTAGLMHYPGNARRWKGILPGRIDSREAWAVVREFEGRKR